MTGTAEGSPPPAGGEAPQAPPPAKAPGTAALSRRILGEGAGEAAPRWSILHDVLLRRTREE